jgi:hypothetical protein
MKSNKGGKKNRGMSKQGMNEGNKLERNINKLEYKQDKNEGQLTMLPLLHTRTL